ncbi:P-loop containing nucleoside triphosphate hydrolase protein [Penicillium hispanicum]|uniref:P-loop containing nucleoside triphosphate hydrolase protein n=1 Tax=Penicillium hispanicum TaxID=1080232 RepID=UPI002541DE88|nr:P-loop containing nucleoside triphosphate hydrolase protein [Penicillium hispanicum]KAJ5577521.1 P-loop containing nucleoside triphosphate hydrolase protein [Penicillium hispanicum]
MLADFISLSVLPSLDALTTARLSQTWTSRIQLAAFNHASQLPLHRILKYKGISTILDTAQNITLVISLSIFDVFPAIAELWFTISVRRSFGPYVLEIIVVFVITLISLELTSSNRASHVIRAKREVIKIITDTFTHPLTMIAFDQAQYHLRWFQTALTAVLEQERSIDMHAIKTVSVKKLLSNFSFFLVLQIMKYNKASYGDVVFIVSYWRQKVAPILKFFYTLRNIRFNGNAAEPLFTLLNEELPSTITQTAESPREVSALVLRNVSFTYPDSQGYCLKDVSFACTTNKITAVVGETGSGKSSLLKLIMRVEDIEKGQIELDGINIKDITTSSLRRSISMVLDSDYFFRTESILKNLRYAREDATDQDIENACREAQIHDLIVGLPNGYHRLFRQMSAGQELRMSLARAFIRNSSIILLDEPTCRLDKGTEKKVIEALIRRSKAGHMIIVATHSPAIVEAADCVVTLDKGCIVTNDL